MMYKGKLPLVDVQKSDIATKKLILIDYNGELVGSGPSSSCSMQNYEAREGGKQKTSCIYQVSKRSLANIQKPGK